MRKSGLDDTSAETLDDPYPARRRFFHVTKVSAGLTIFLCTVAGVTLALTLFTTISNANLDNRMLTEHDWVSKNFVSRPEEDERARQLDRRLQEIRETQIQISTQINEFENRALGNRR